jgi:hypothetical protein
MTALQGEYHLNAEQRRALKILAAAGPDGCTGATLFARRFIIYMLAELVHDGLATARAETVRMGARKITVARLWITDAGRMAIEG